MSLLVTIKDIKDTVTVKLHQLYHVRIFRSILPQRDNYVPDFLIHLYQNYQKENIPYGLVTQF